MEVITSDKQYIIFGTGSIAKNIYDKLAEKGIAPVFFLDSMLEKEEFCGKKVYGLDYLEQIQPNEYHYFLGTIGNTVSMRHELMSRGVSESNIEIAMDFSEAGFEKRVKKVDEILIYPECDEQEQVVIQNNIDEYFGYREQVSIRFVSEKSEYDHIDCNNYDVILVWNKDCLYDEFLEESEVVFCIDNTFYLAIMERILMRMAYKFLSQRKLVNFDHISKENFRKLKSQGFEEAYVFGNGPSLKEGIQITRKCANSKSCVVVCNAYVNLQSKDRIIPQVYCFEEVGFIRPERFDVVLKAMDYACENECFFVVPMFWLPYIHRYNSKIINYIIGYEAGAGEINFLTENNLQICCKGGNVITAVSIPVASAFVDRIYISGCDGMKKKGENWEYSPGIASKIKSDLTKVDWNDYEDKHNAFFEKLLEVGEKMGKEYICITDSYMDCLSRRRGNVK